MRRVYMLRPRTERLGSEIAAHVYTLPLARSRAASRMQL
jgi:hypothetical protein